MWHSKAVVASFEPGRQVRRDRNKAKHQVRGRLQSAGVDSAQAEGRRLAGYSGVAAKLLSEAKCIKMSDTDHSKRRYTYLEGKHLISCPGGWFHNQNQPEMEVVKLVER